MSLDRLWAGWRSAYVETVANKPPVGRNGCVLCRLADSSDDEGLVLERGESTFAVMNAYPYTSGHLMVAPVRHVGEIDELTSGDSTGFGELMELAAMVQRAVRAMRAAYAPDGMNVGVNLGRAGGAGVPGHVHVHVLARWSGDTNFMTAVGEVRVIPEDLAHSYQKLLDAWPAQ